MTVHQYYIFSTIFPLYLSSFFVMFGVVTNRGHTLARGIFNGTRKMEFRYCGGVSEVVSDS
jgi:hypothetical protein